MTDLHALLHEAAPTPRARIDVDRVVAEATRRRRLRRLRLWFGAGVVALGVGSGAAGVLAPADHPAQVETLPGPPTQIDDTTGAIGHDVGTTTSLPAPIADGADPREARATSAPPTATAEEQTASEGCVAEGTTEGVGLGHNGGLYAQEQPRCRYEATQAAGYEGRGSWVLEIRRGTEDIAYRGGESPDCMPVGVVQPGDVVTVWTDAGTEAATDPPYIRVGPSEGC
jgi:hypothetical protein